MIAVDTSALIAIVLNEPSKNACISALSAADAAVMSAGTLLEAMIVAERNGRSDAMRRLIEGLNVEIQAVDEAAARRAADAYARWGKGIHPAGLNFGDCFAYACARANGCPLLFVGDDFTKTDIQAAI